MYIQGGSLPLYAILSLLFLSTLFYDGGTLWWLTAVLSTTYAIFAFWCLSALLPLRRSGQFRAHPGLLLFALPLLFGLFQLLPLGDTVRLLSPQAWQHWQEFNAIGIYSAAPRLSLNLDGTALNCRLLLLCALSFLLIFNFGRSRRHLLLIMLAVAASALGNALLAYWQFFSNQQLGLSEVFCGSFQNRNHFGFMMSLGILASLGLLSVLKKETLRRHSSFEAWQPLRIPLLMTVFLLLVAQVLSLSRGAFLSSCLALCLYGMFWYLPDRYGAAGRRGFPALLILVLGAALFALQSGLSYLAQRYELLIGNEVFSSDLRFSFWKDSLKLIRDFPLVGCGLGAYGDTIQAYESGRVSTVLLEHAHNDWLELLSGLGLPLGLGLALLFFALLALALRRLWRQQEPVLRWLGLAALAALFAGLIHEFFDYNLQAMPNALLYSVLLAVLFACARGKEERQGPAYRLSAWLTKMRLGRASLLALALLFLLLLPKQFTSLQGELMHSRLRETLLRVAEDWQANERGYQVWLQLSQEAASRIDSAHLLMRQAACAVELAELLPEQSRHYWQLARLATAEACARAPRNGKFLLDTAQVYERSWPSFPEQSHAIVQALYAGAYSSQPHISSNLRAVAEGLTRLYWQVLPEDKNAAAELRLQARQCFTQYLSLAPYSAAEVFTQILELDSEMDELLQIAPDNLLYQQKLLEHLSMRQQFAPAFLLLQRNRQIWLEPGQSLAEQPADLAWYEWQCRLLTMSKQWDKRKAMLYELHKRCKKHMDEQLEKSKKPSNADELSKAESLLLSLNRYPPRHWPALLRLAELMQDFGRFDEVCSSLLPLVYSAEPVKPEYLRQALALSRNSLAGGRAMLPDEREEFLNLALQILLAEAENQVGEKTLHQILEQLEALEQPSVQKNSMAWLQDHLYAYYRGRAYALMGKFELAAAAYAQSAQRSADNFLLWLAEQSLPEQFRSQTEAPWLSLLQDEEQSQFAFSNNFTLLGASKNQETFSRFHEKLVLDLYWLCTGDILEDCSAQLRFYNQNGLLFKDEFSFIDLQMPITNMRLGQVYCTRREYTPLLKMVQGGKMIEDCQVMLQISLHSLQKNSRRVYKGMPEAIFPLFQLRREF